MIKTVGIIVLVTAASSLNLLAQTPEDLSKYSAPTLWGSYKVPDENLSVSFPKLPVVLSSSDICQKVVGSVFYTYAGDAVYELALFKRSSEDVPSWCSPKPGTLKESFFNRIEEFKKDAGFVQSEVAVYGKRATLLRWKGQVNERSRWLIWDDERWIELGIMRRKDAVVDEDWFVKGLAIANQQAQKIGNGSPKVLGDLHAVADNPAVTRVSNAPFTLLTKPKAGYTTMARMSSTQGKVVLEVTFLHNGAVGKISVVTGLRDGLTESSIAAARKIAFLPQRKDGKNVTVVKTVEYGFSIY